MKVVIDSYAWIEYLDGSAKGKRVKDILGSENECYTLPLTISEVISRAERTNKDVDIAYEIMTNNSKIVNLDASTSKEAGLFHAHIRKKIHDFGIVDAFIFIVACKLGAKIITGDLHFKGFKEAVMI